MARCKWSELESGFCQHSSIDDTGTYCGFKNGKTPGGQLTINTFQMIGCPKDKANLLQRNTIHDAYCNGCKRVFQFRKKFINIDGCPLCKSTAIEEYYGIPDNK